MNTKKTPKKRGSKSNKSKVIKAAKKTGRPTIYTRAVAKDICTKLSNGESMVDICKPESMPCQGSVYGWLRGDACPEPEIFLKMYSRARKSQSHAMADEVTHLPDSLEKEREEKGILMDFNDLRERTKLTELRMKARMWHTARLNPRKYGENINSNINSKNKTEVAIVDTDARSKLAEKLAKAIS